MEQGTESIAAKESSESPIRSALDSPGDAKDDTHIDKADGTNKATKDAHDPEIIESNSKDSIDHSLEDISSCEDLMADSPEVVAKDPKAYITQTETVESCTNSTPNDPCTEVDNLKVEKKKSGTASQSEPQISVETSDAPETQGKMSKETSKDTAKDKLDEAQEASSVAPSCIDAKPQSEDFSDLEPAVETVKERESDASKLTEVTKSNSEQSNVDLEIRLKDTATEKPIDEPENTEFVQISQDKQDDSQIEGQSIDAEDPFGGDNLTSDNVEQLENESPTTDDVNFRKLGDQADNLQDVVNAKETSFKTKPAREENIEAGNNPEEITESNVAESSVCESSSKSKEDVEVESVVETESTTDVIDSELNDKTPADKNESEPAESPNETNDESKKKSETNVPMETEEAQSDVLPGQDDELCIIPDNMKETTIIDVEACENANKDKTNAEKNESSKNNAEEQAILTKEPTCMINAAQVNEVNDDKSEETAPDRQDKGKEKANLEVAVTDVIDIDDELKNSEIEEIATKEVCKQCNELQNCSISVKVGTETFNVCSKTCKDAFIEANNKAMDIPSDGVNSKREKRCASCLLIVEADDERNLSWETMEFCNEECLGKFQTKYGSYCRNCNGSVQPISLGKYCVRFGYDVRQFCCSSCLEEFKKGLKVCSYCQKDISTGTEGFLAPVGDKGQFKDFCTQLCMQKYSKINSTEPPTEKKACSVCQEEKIVHCEVQIERSSPVAICSDPCFAAFKFVNKVDPDQCSTCKKFFELSSLSSSNKKSFVVFYEKEAHTFCNKTCLNIFIITNRKIVPCNWCKVKKYNFDMIKKELKTGQVLMMCSLNCLTLYQVSINAVSAKRINCDFCKEFSQAQYHLTMSDATIRNFCSYNCVMKFQSQYTKSPITIPASDDPVPTGTPKRTYPPAKSTNQAVPMSSEVPGKKTLPVISSVTSLASLTPNGQAPPTAQPSIINNATVATTVASAQVQSPQVIVKQQVITRPLSPVKIHNKVTQCKPLTHTKGVSVRPHPCVKSTQTDDELRAVIPIPVPIYVPFPVHMWSMPYPVPMPFPLPIPVPIFIPTTRNSAKGIFKELKRIQEKIPADPFEAELLMMAEMVATEKKNNESDSASSDDNVSEAVDSNNTFGEDMLQMALKMATGELDEPAVDLEAALTPNTITASQAQTQPETAIETDGQPERLIPATRGKKRMVPYKPRTTPSKRGRRVSGAHDVPIMPPPESQPQSQSRIMEPIEKPDANMALKYTFGVNAWRQWVVCKNAELEKQITTSRKVKLFKTDLLQLTADELNYTLCLFVKEVRKPNGAEYAPDTIYYLCLGIQQYLFENNRIDNIFTDSYYEKFTDCLNDVAKKFSVLYNDAQYIVTRVEEEHLWECKQLGAHSPHVLLSTLMFFNTKHFNLVTVEEHMQLSFSHIMKHWKRNPAAQTAAVAGKVPSTRNVLLRFYPPQSALEANSRKKKVYEQQENDENPLRCPVKLYEFYLSKCPESVKTRNDVFYLLPERSCVPDSPVWYSTSPLAKEHLIKMLHRVKMVKEINVALLTS